ncbi:ATP-grasp peptide maturase system methyltransferase [Streptomyces cucumeris]|uniref:ATP-grasp peptide maturase system methyltransferase n=1 Tax=Streptomyces cucumeris TaxID=2962890 RepID=UPI0020C899AE|nr:ATP-grasp peptide maturase system methyltransferase [Streptomyces sp. NEAU-Y11]MCP9209234.1 ATP-grasp peptide maturase system methyltransferase [Streptomyces sp. NEAU-Y11]
MTEPSPASVDEQRAARLRLGLADQLEEGGHLRSPAWRAAVETVPRHLFTSAFFRRTHSPRGTLWTPVTPELVGTDTWLEEVYADSTLVTQLDGRTHPADADGPVPGDPTSSSTLPSLVVRMLEDLDPQDGDRVLEVGTGTGYSTALMCHRLGSGQVTSIEYDSAAAGRAHAAITAAGYTPTLINGDGLLGFQDNAPYDRLIATCSVRTVPLEWLRQVRAGGTILATLSGWLYGSGLLRLTVGDDGTAEGTFLPGTVSFMIARPQAAPALSHVSDPLDQPADERPTRFGPEVLSEWLPQFIAQLAAPSAQYLGISTDGGPMLDHLVDVSRRSFATLLPDGQGAFLVRQGGPARLWDAVEDALGTWRRAGSPPQTAFGLTVTPERQRVWLTDPGGPSWPLPI